MENNNTANLPQEKNLNEITKSLPPKHNYLLIVILIILLFVIIASSFFWGKRLLTLFSKTNPIPTITPKITITPDLTADWKTYINNDFGYSLKYPENLSLEEMGVDTIVINGKFARWIWIDKQIHITISDKNPNVCLGDCPIVESQENIKINNLSGQKLTGYIGSVGGNIPQRYYEIILPRNNLFYIFTLYELKNDSIKSQYRKIGNIFPDKIELFNKIVSTVKFIDSNNTELNDWKTATFEGFSFQYPASWNYIPKSPGCGPVIKPLGEDNWEYWIGICKFGDVESKTAEDEANRIANSTGVEVIETYKKISLNGNEAVTQAIYSSDKYSVETYLFNKGELYTIYGYGNTKEKLDEFKSIYDQVSLSFKFL